MSISKKKDYIVSWMKEKRELASAEGGILGVSGGVDSALVLGLAKEAYGDSVLGLVMPIKSDPQDVDDALKILKKLGIRHKVLDLGGVYENFLAASNADCGNTLVAANIKPRLRMTALYYHGGLENYLVLGTSNKNEIYVGYFTKHGDGGADLWPIGDLTKDEVNEMSKIVGVPQEIIDKVPSGGLWPGQTDEEEIGVSYKEMNAFLKGEEVDVKSRERLYSMHKRSEHKRSMPPIPKFKG